MERIVAGKREIVLHMHSRFTLKGSTCPTDYAVASQGRAPYSKQATGRVSGDAMPAPSQRTRQYLSSPTALTFYRQSPHLCSAEVSV